LRLYPRYWGVPPSVSAEAATLDLQQSVMPFRASIRSI
jgi:hypothetical protein